MNQKLVETIVLYLVQRLKPLESGSDTTKFSDGVYFWHGATSTMENACAVLWRLGIAKAAITFSRSALSPDEYTKAAQGFSRNPGFPAYFNLPERDEVLIRLRAAPAITRADLDELISAYLDYAVSYEEDPLPTTKDTYFVPPKRHMTFMELMSEEGFAEQRVDTFRWKRKVNSIFQSLGFCD